MIYVISYDVGTTGMKSCLFRVDRSVEMIASSYQDYELYILPEGGAEQDQQQWWDAMCNTTKNVLNKSGLSKKDISAISFCSQMQGLVLVDKDLNPVRPPMSYMDQRASDVMKEIGKKGITVSGLNFGMLLKCLQVTKAAPTSVKDPLWKYKWVEKHEPEKFAKVYKWLDVKEYLIARCTGNCVMTKDSAYATMLYDPKEECFSDSLIKQFGIKKEHIPNVIECTDVAGYLSEEAAGMLGLAISTKVYGGGGDATLIGLGAGCCKTGDTHIYCGTSGWVSTITDKQAVDIDYMIAAIVGAQQGKYNYFAEMETAGKSFEWVKDHLALDEIDVYLEKTDVCHSKEAQYESLYNYLSDVVEKVPDGSGGVIFTPWLHGNRCPFEDSKALGMFFNLGLETGKSQMIRAVLEGICYHMRWMLECSEKKVKSSDTIRFVGGGALSDATCQILADVTGRTIETVEYTKDIGSIGAAVLVAIGEAEIDNFDEVANIIKVRKKYLPNAAVKNIHDRNYKVFINLYKSNKKNYNLLNG